MPECKYRAFSEHNPTYAVQCEGEVTQEDNGEYYCVAHNPRNVQKKVTAQFRRRIDRMIAELSELGYKIEEPR